MRTNKELTLAVLVTIKRLSSVLGFRVQDAEKKYNNKGKQFNMSPSPTQYRKRTCVNKARSIFKWRIKLKVTKKITLGLDELSSKRHN